MRPEATAGAARAYVEHGVHNQEPVSRWYYMGPMFRGERPAKGRYRQFYQLGAEVFGDPGPAATPSSSTCSSASCARSAMPGVEVLVNSLGGGPETRAKYKEALVAALLPHKDELSAGLAAPADHEPAPHSRLEGSAGSTRPSASARQPHRVPERGRPRPLRRAAPPARRARHAVHRRRRASCAGSTTTRARSSRSKGRQEKLGAGRHARRRRPLRRHDRRSSAARACRRSASRPGSSACSSPASETAAEPVVDVARRAARRGAPRARRSSSRASCARRASRRDADTRGGSLKSQLRRANALGARVALILGDNELDDGQSSS